jgi:hypothetical protein
MLPEPARRELTRELMSARRAKGVAIQVGDLVAKEAARARVDDAKTALGERGPPWWTDGMPDFNRQMAENTPYADWWTKVSPKCLVERSNTTLS